MKHVLVISYVPAYNRQGFDLNRTLNDNGFDSWLVQSGAETDMGNHVLGFRIVPAHGVLHHLHTVINMYNFLRLTFFRRKDVVVCIGRTVLLFGVLYKLVFRSRVVYYSLEYRRDYKKLELLGLKKYIDAYIDVEENRREKMYAEYSIVAPWMVVYNMPRCWLRPPRGGALKACLNEKFGITEEKKVAIYAGSNQSYACLDNIVSASKFLPENVVVVVMAYAFRYDGMLPENCKIIQPCSGDAFYDWLADADLALLPYEDENDFNVRNCSPQKLFDCYLTGVPYLASKRPLIEKMLLKYPQAGAFCNFCDVNEIAAEIAAHINTKSEMVSGVMRKLHCNELNYDRCSGTLARFVVSDNS